MKRYATIIFSFTCATNLLFAQQDVWTIDKCMRYAIEHNFDVRANAISLDNSRSDYRQAVASFFPTIGASISADYSFGRSIDPSTNSYNNLKTFNNSYSLSASWTIFAGGQIVNQFRQAKKQREQSTEKLQNAKDETALKVMEAYVNLQYYRALSGITASKLEESRALLGKSRRMKELGMNSAIEVSQAEAQYAEDDYTHTATLGQLQTAELSLKNAMNFPISTKLSTSRAKTIRSHAKLASTSKYRAMPCAKQKAHCRHPYLCKPVCPTATTGTSVLPTTVSARR